MLKQRKNLETIVIKDMQRKNQDNIKIFIIGNLILDRIIFLEIISRRKKINKDLHIFQIIFK